MQDGLLWCAWIQALGFQSSLTNPYFCRWIQYARVSISSFMEVQWIFSDLLKSVCGVFQPRPWMPLIRVLVCRRISGINEAQCFLLNVFQLYHNCFAKWPKWKQSVWWLAVPVIISLLAKQIQCCSPITAECSATPNFQVTTNKLFGSANMLFQMMFVILKDLITAEISMLTRGTKCLNVLFFPPSFFLLGLLLFTGATMTPSRQRWLKKGSLTFMVATQHRWHSQREEAWLVLTAWGSAHPLLTAFVKTPGGGTLTSLKSSPCSATLLIQSSLTPRPTCSTCAMRMTKSKRTWGTLKGYPSWWACLTIRSQRSIVRPAGLSETSPTGRIMKTRWL